MTEIKEDNDKKSKEPPKDNIIETKHSSEIGGKKINYTVNAGTIVLKHGHFCIDIE